MVNPTRGLPARAVQRSGPRGPERVATSGGPAMMLSVQRTAYVDESEPDQRADPGTYLLAAAVVADHAAEPGRATMSGLLLPGQHKVHWNREPDRQQQLADAVGDSECTHLVVVRTEVGVKAERQRRLCLERLLFELERIEVHHVVMEARQAKQNDKDVEMLNALRSRQVVSSAVRISHIPGPKEPLLWMPDVVAGAYGAHRQGQAGPFTALTAKVQVHTCS